MAERIFTKLIYWISIYYQKTFLWHYSLMVAPHENWPPKRPFFGAKIQSLRRNDEEFWEN